MYKKLIEGKKAIFFDLDGTIVDTTLMWAEAVDKVLVEMEINWISAPNRYFPGDCLQEQWKRLLKDYKINTNLSLKQLVDKTNQAFLKILEGVNELEAVEGFWSFLYEVRTEKGLKVVLITNSIKQVGEAILEKLGATKAFDLIIYGDEIQNPKPDPEIYKKALASLNLSPKEALVFEDSPTGAKAAAKADLEMVIIWNEETSPPPSEYQGKILLALPDFSPLPGELDQTFEERWEMFLNARNKPSQ